MEIFSQVKKFEWDEGNINKNWEKHKVTHFECEEVFFNEPLMVDTDEVHSFIEKRYFALGETDTRRLLFVVFTIRSDKIRVISVRDMNKKREELLPMKDLKEIPEFRKQEEEFEFWSTHDSTEYIDYSKGKKVVFSNLKPSVKTISIRLPEYLIAHLRALANKRDIPYQSLMKIFLTERIESELHA